MGAGPPSPLQRTLAAVPESVPVLRGAVTEFARTAGASPLVLEQIRLAVSEAVTNVVIHAYVGAPEPGQVHVDAHVDDETVNVVVADDGRGIVPRVDSPGLGLGLALIAQAADHLDVHDGDPRGTELRMAFALAG
jgi:serine/threonine-protein kinase RsbW